jgi:hypothetical protein
MLLEKLKEGKGIKINMVNYRLKGEFTVLRNILNFK